MNASPPTGIPWPVVDLTGQLLERVRQIPAGRVTTFGDIAASLGDRQTARWVASELARIGQESPEQLAGLPWHRVLRKTGELDPLRSSREATQLERLQQEGLWNSSSGLVDFSDFWTDFHGVRPFEELIGWQREVASRSDCTSACAVPDVVAGIDLSYRSPTEAVAAYVAVDVRTRAVQQQLTITQPVTFPYISGYLTFRELPVMTRLLAAAAESFSLAPVILVDGAGQLHPRRCGIAVAVGVMTGRTTIGIAKHHLAGTPAAEPQLPLGQALWHQRSWTGLRTNGGVEDSAASKRAAKRLFDVSPGHGINIESAIPIVHALWERSRGPVPIWHADRISREIARMSPESSADEAS